MCPQGRQQVTGWNAPKMQRITESVLGSRSGGALSLGSLGLSGAVVGLTCGEVTL